MTARPETGDIKPGMTMFIQRSPNDSRRRPAADRHVEVTVTAAHRVWITVTDGISEWRIRRDRMDEGTQYSGNNASLVTVDQKNWDVRQHVARLFLDAQGINLAYGSPWNGREQVLADLVRQVAP